MALAPSAGMIARPVAYELTRCPVCDSPDSDEVAGPDDLRDEVEALWAFHGARLRGATPPEHLVDRVAFSQPPPWRVARCKRCTLIFRNPRERPRELEEAYARDSADPGVLASLFETQRNSHRSQARRLTRIVGRAGTGLEVGSYAGGFLAAAAELGWSFEGIDVNEAAVGFTRGLGHTATTGDLESWSPNRPVDAVAIWNCFEQLPEPRATLRRAREVLAPEGVLAIRTPNGAFWYGLQGVRAGPAAPVARALLAHNNLLGLPYRHAFTEHSLEVVLDATGFRLLRVIGDVLVPISDRWTRSWAALEERAAKRILRLLPARLSPWLEVYARRR